MNNSWGCLVLSVALVFFKNFPVYFNIQSDLGIIDLNKQISGITANKEECIRHHFQNNMEKSFILKECRTGETYTACSPMIQKKQHTFVQPTLEMKQFATLQMKGVIKGQEGISLVVQWLRIRLPMQGIQVQYLIGELRSHMPQSS